MLRKYVRSMGFWLGVIGLIIFIFSQAENHESVKNVMVLFATFFLFLSAIIQKEPFFSGLQGIVFVSAIMVFYNIAQLYGFIVFVFLAFVFSVYYFGKHKLNIARVFAFIGLVALCLGIVLSRNEPMVVCGITLAIYSVFSIRQGFSVGWVFLALNVLFALVAANALYRFY